MCLCNFSGVKTLSLYLDVAGSASLPYGWRRRAELCLSVVNHVSEELTEIKGDCFYRSCPQTILKTDSMIYIPKINHLDSSRVLLEDADAAVSDQKLNIKINKKMGEN